MDCRPHKQAPALFLLTFLLQAVVSVGGAARATGPASLVRPPSAVTTIARALSAGAAGPSLQPTTLDPSPAPFRPAHPLRGSERHGPVTLPAHPDQESLRWGGSVLRPRLSRPADLLKRLFVRAHGLRAPPTS